MINIPPPVIAAVIQLNTAVGNWLPTLLSTVTPMPVPAAAPVAPVSPAAIGMQAARHPSVYNLKKYDYSVFDSSWKFEKRLTEKGIEAICYAIMSGIDIPTVAKTFKVNQGAPYAYVQRIAGTIPWGRNKIPSWL